MGQKKRGTKIGLRQIPKTNLNLDGGPVVFLGENLHFFLALDVAPDLPTGYHRLQHFTVLALLEQPWQSSIVEET